MPGLHRLGHGFGNGRADEHLFQLDSAFAVHRAAKVRNRNRRLSMFYQTRDFDLPTRQAIARLIIDRLLLEHAGHFSMLDHQLVCHLTGDVLPLDAKLNLIGSPLGYIDTLDALAMNVCEDLCVTCIDPHNDWLAAAHLMQPNGWSPAEKIGKSFFQIHRPVPGIEKINAKARQHAEMMVSSNKGLVRFVWGFRFDDRLDHHPDDDHANPPARDPEKLHVRVERQTIVGLPESRASLFVIRTQLTPVQKLNAEQCGALIGCIDTMSPEQRVYKGIDGVEELLRAKLLEQSQGLLGR
jgi:dimethylamine monooxygenase subunit A